MIDIEAEYKGMFFFHRKWANHYRNLRSHRAHSSTIGMMEPAENTYRFIETIHTKDKTYREKIALLADFYDEQNRFEKRQMRMGSGYYSNCLQYVKHDERRISMGEPIEYTKIGRR